MAEDFILGKTALGQSGLNGLDHSRRACFVGDDAHIALLGVFAVALEALQPAQRRDQLGGGPLLVIGLDAVQTLGLLFLGFAVPVVDDAPCDHERKDA